MPLTRIKTTVIDHVFLSEFLGTVASESAMLALVGGIGDYAVRSDLNNDSFIITQNDGSSIDDWQKISNSSTALLKSENLSDLSDAATARTSLGLGTAATNDTGDFLQPSNNLSDLNNSGTALDNLGFSTFGKSIIDDADAAAVRTTLGLGEVATLDVAGGAQDFVATGAISAGQIVGLRSDGTIELIEDGTTTQTEDVGTPVVFNSPTTSEISAIFDSSQNKVVIAYQDAGNSSRGTAVVGTVSGTSISVGSPFVFESGSTYDISAIFDSSQNKVVIAYRDSGNSSRGTAVVGTVSGTSISFGPQSIFESGQAIYNSATFDSSQNKIVIAYRNSGNYGAAVVGTISANSISFGTPVVFNSASTDYISAIFDSSQNKVVIAYRGNSEHGTAVVGSVSGTSISFGSPITPVVFNSDSTIYISATFDSSQNKVVIAYTDNGNSQHGKAVVGTVSGTSISFGSPITPVVFESASTSNISATFDSTSNKVIIAYRDGGNSYYGTAVAGTVSGDTIDFGDPITPVVFESASTEHISTTFDSTSNKVIIAYRDGGNSYYGTAVVYTPPGTVPSTNADSWLGIASQNISDGGTGTVTILSGINESLTSLTPGASYYVNYDGSLTATENAGPVLGTYGKIGRALSSTKLLITEGNA